jgi:hypothetical protein
VSKQLGPSLALLGRDGGRIFTEFRTHRHRFFDGGTLADLVPPAFDVGEFREINAP